MSTGFRAAVVTTTMFSPSGSSISSTRGVPPSSWRRAARTSVLELSQEPVEIECTREHDDVTVVALRARPLCLGPVSVQLDPVVVRIAQVDRLADAVVARAFQRDAGRKHAP